jgi:hypothetical protein
MAKDCPPFAVKEVVSFSQVLWPQLATSKKRSQRSSQAEDGDSHGAEIVGLTEACCHPQNITNNW